jgi:hypothetical protein
MSAARFVNEETRIAAEGSTAGAAVAAAATPDTVSNGVVPQIITDGLQASDAPSNSNIPQIITVGQQASGAPMSAARFANEQSRIAAEGSTAGAAAAVAAAPDTVSNGIVPQIITEGLQASGAPSNSNIPQIITVGQQASGAPMSAARFANEESRIADERESSKNEAPEEIESDPAARKLSGSKRLKQKWDTDTLPMLPKAEYTGDRPNNKSCVSIDRGTADSWCQTMCASTAAIPTVTAMTCPKSTCRCDSDAVAQVKAEHDDVIDNWKEAEARVRTADPDTAYPDGLPHFEHSKPTPDLPTKAKRNHLAADPTTCKSIHIQATDRWCANQCATEECPLTLCKCEGLEAPRDAGEQVMDEKGTTFSPYEAGKDFAKDAVPAVPIMAGRVKSLQPTTCRAIRDDATDEYCVILCATQDCPLDLCKCADTPTIEEAKEAARKTLQSPEIHDPVLPSPLAAEPDVAAETNPEAQADPEAETGTPLTGLKSIAATCTSMVESGTSVIKYQNDLWCKTTCAQGNCPKAQCDCGPDMDYVTEEDEWQAEGWESKDQGSEGSKDNKLAKAGKRDKLGKADKFVKGDKKGKSDRRTTWKAKKHGPKWNAKHSPDKVSDHKNREVSQHTRKKEEPISGEQDNLEKSDDEKSDDEESEDDVDAQIAEITERAEAQIADISKRAKYQHHLKHAQHVKHVQHVQHAQHAQRALDRMQTEYAQRERVHAAKMQTDEGQRFNLDAISAREVDEPVATAPTDDIAWNVRPAAISSEAEVNLGGGARFLAGSSRRSSH